MGQIKRDPYKLQMDALLAMDQMQNRQESLADANTDSQMMSHLGNFVNVASKPVATQAEIMSKQAPVDSNMGDAWKEAGQNIQASAGQDYQNLLDTFKSKNDMAVTVAQLNKMRGEEDKRSKEMSLMDAKISEMNRPYGESKDYQKQKMIAEMKSGLKTGGLTKGQETADKEFAKDWTKFNALGGYSVIENNLSKLNKVKDSLKNQINKKGKSFFDVGLSGRTLGLMGDDARSLISPESQDVIDAVSEVAQGNLRQVLGGQFAQKEGEAIIKRAFNPKLSEKINLMRVERLIEQINKVASAKVKSGKWFDQYGSLKGYSGTSLAERFNSDDFYKGLNGEGEGPGIVSEAMAGESKPKTIYRMFNGKKHQLTNGKNPKIKSNWEVVNE
jgi:hypothetical protein